MQNLPRIGLLATGEELVQGDILNTNGQSIARQLADLGFNVGSHVMVGDAEGDITHAIEFLLTQHEIVIITGGLGPTSDDRTRFALSKAIDKPLIFDEQSWQNILKRIQRFGFEAHESNKQQALFPQDATIIMNPHGTAAGCKISNNNTIFYMLPGPPRECLSMFSAAVLPELLQMDIQNDHVYKKWRLFSVNESEIAALLDNIVSPYQCVTGYRWDYPYLEFKLHIPAGIDLSIILPTIESTLAPHIICDANYTASQALQEKLTHYDGSIIINDEATGGLLQATLLNPNTQHCLHFEPGRREPTLFVEIKGLSAYWKNEPIPCETELTITVKKGEQQEQHKKIIPYRSSVIRLYAVEYISYWLLQYLP